MVAKRYGWEVGKPAPPLEDHTRAKHAVLRQYTERYLEIVTQTPSQRELNFTVVDGFAGGGRYSRDGLIVAGSPLLLIEAVRKIEASLNLSRSNGFKINADFFFVEEDAATFDYLSETICRSQYASGIRDWIHLIRGDLNTQVHSICEHVKKKGTAHRSLFLLDQCGWGQVALSTVRTIYHGLKHSEVFLPFGVDSLIDYLSDRTSELSAAIAAELDDGFVRDLVRIRESEQVGWRALIQHGLYGHLRNQLDAKYSSPFFLMSSKSHRALWFLHLSKRWKARDEIGIIHWNSASGSVDHRGDPGFEPLGFTPERKRDPSQLILDFGFDEAAKERSRAALRSQLCDKIIQMVGVEGHAPSLEHLFDQNCNDTPVTSAMLQDAILTLRSESELVIRRADGRLKTTGSSVLFGDRLERPRQQAFPGLLSDRR
jgi:three-Cys-motif partner protein